MKCRIGAVTALTFALACSSAGAATVKVHLRVEGAKNTLYEGNVKTDGHTIDGHPCDGTNGGANPTAGPTATAALDDAATKNKFTWVGTWNEGFGDYFVDLIDNEKPSGTNFWESIVNYAPSQVGGCQQRIAAGDEVVWANASGSETHFLKLTGPSKVTVGKAFKLKVTDGATGKPVTGSKVGKLKVPANGVLKLKAKKKGSLRFVAEAPASIRSNGVTVVFKATK
jgi:hypothetical protein